MSPMWLFLIVIALAVVGYVLGRQRAFASVEGDRRRLHSLPNYYGMNVLIWTALPAVLLLIVWLIAQPIVIKSIVSGELPEDSYDSAGALTLLMSDVRNIAEGLDALVEGGMSEAEVQSLPAEDIRSQLQGVGVVLGSDVDTAKLGAARHWQGMSHGGDIARSIVVLIVALGFGAWAWSRSSGEFRARNVVETTVMALLISAALIAILTTIGIVLSLIFNTIAFFRLYPAADFFFGTTWSPSFGGGSSLGILPLLWGTLYVSVIALIVAVPIGLFAAVYLSEYATPRVRSVVKPLLEVLAGIPTIVYGLFALLTVGPLLLEIFGPNSVGWMRGGTSVMTAGLVMGIMLIPFVSSLSDDIINAVPQAMRDGSYGLGATQSETIRQVILPAALPGIVGAVLLAASRAIGETMIVVLGAGAAARLSMNPFEAMTTITTRIVSQLTGDADFSSPEALVAFSLGMTLFVITLGLNIFALWIVRRYREQYE